MAFHVEGRKVKVVTGQRSQTVNVYVDEAREGLYDPKIRIHTPSRFVDEDCLMAKGFTSVAQMVEFLRETHGGVNEGPSSPYAGRQPSLPREPVPVDRAWAMAVVPEVEGAINEFVREFLGLPYLHRVEHSIHCALYGHLKRREMLRQLVSLGRFTTSAVHKEWPETIARDGKRGRRGNFDLAILGPPAPDSGAVDVEVFCRGLIRPAAVIEIGLDYGIDHLEGDILKLKNSNVERGYLVHLARWTGESQKDVQERVRELVQDEGDGRPSIAFAYVGETETKYRLLGEPAITTRPH